MKRIIKHIYTSCLLLSLICFSCSMKNIKNSKIIPFLEEIPVDTFGFESQFQGIVYLIARSINDSAFICIMPSDCVEKGKIGYSFFFSNKLFVCDGDMRIFDEIIRFYPDISETAYKDRNWRFCSEIKYHGDYDPPYIILFVDKDNIEKVKVSDEKVSQIIFGDKYPPPPLPIEP